MPNNRDHGGGLDAAIKQYGGQREDWLDLSTGINPVAYPIGHIPDHAWQSLPDSAAQSDLLQAAAKFWNIPEGAGIIASSGVSQLIAMLPSVLPPSDVEIQTPTYNEHAAAFKAAGWHVQDTGKARVIVHPNNPDGRTYTLTIQDTAGSDLTIIDESFCDTIPDQTLIGLASQPNVIVLKGLGKFWGLAGLRLGFAIAAPDLIHKISNRIGPWAVSGPAQFVGQAALSDQAWVDKTRVRLALHAGRLDSLLERTGATLVGGTDLFRLYNVNDAAKFQEKLAGKYVWSRVFPYSTTWVRLGLPGSESQWNQLSKALEL